jgi:hypothetical protein
MNGRLLSVVLAASVALPVTACGSGSAPPTPATTTSPATDPVASDSHVGPGVFRSANFMPGLRVELPDDRWSVDSDAGGELDLLYSGPGGGTVRVSKGLFPVNPHGEFLTTRMSPAAVVAALRQNSMLETSVVGDRRLGDGLRARVLDVMARSVRQVPYLAYQGVGLAGVSFEIREGQASRVYTALIHAPYGLDLVNISVSPSRARDLDTWAAQAERVLQTLVLPSGVRAVR